MFQSKNVLLTDIQTGLRISWMNAATDNINSKVNAIQGTDGATGVRRHRERKILNDAALKEFDAFWEYELPYLEQQYDALYATVEEKLLQRHPWLQYDQTPSPYSMKDVFLFKTLQILLFNLLKNKSKTAKTWENILIIPNEPFVWNEIDHQWLDDQIEGYPLSDTDYYNDRLLPTCLDSPFSKSFTRYDLYRLLKKTYPESFKSKKLTNTVSCTAIAPLHHTELAQLTQPEWAHLETILVNISEEEVPEWVLLDKKQDTWIIYAPSFLENKCRDIPVLSKLSSHAVIYSEDKEYAEIMNWHAVLLSRVLPWCRLAQKPALDSYRSTIPISLLYQNALEASCLPAQNKAESASQKAFSKRYPLSLLSAREWYCLELNDTHSETPLLLSGIPETPAHSVINALDTGGIIYAPHNNQLTIMDSNHNIEGMKLAYYQHVTHLVIHVLPADNLLQRWFGYNLELTALELPSHPESDYLYACAARNRFLAKTEYVSKAHNIIEAGQHAWENTGLYIHHFLTNNPSPNKTQLKNIAAMGKEGLDVFFVYLKTLQKPALHCTFDLDSGKTIEMSKYIDYLTQKIRSFEKRPLLTDLDLILPKKINEETQLALVSLLSMLNDRGEIEAVTIQNPSGITELFIQKLHDLVTTKKSLLQIKIPEWDESVFNDLKAQYRELQNKILTNIRQAREPDLTSNTLSMSIPLPVRHLKSTQWIEDDQSWHADASYSLTSGSVGIQQQTQQEVAQEVQQSSEQQSQPKTPVVREILEYRGDEGSLITRNNVKKQGASVDDFSLWVGSRTNAPFVIQRMDVAAFDKIRAFSSLFKFSIDWKHTPGFRLCYSSSQEKDWILTYDATLEAEDIEDQKLEPFAIQMTYAQHAKPFYGDYRQFKVLGLSGDEAELTLWHHLATEKLSKEIQSWLISNHCDPNTSESLQYNNVTHSIKHSLDHNAMVAMIKEWSRSILRTPRDLADAQSEANYDDFLSILYDDFTSHNLQAFGQLYYHYGSKGAVNWLHLVDKLYQAFPNNFSIFKQRLLDPLSDWSECLEKEEVDALTISMQKLSNHPTYQTVLWALIDAHGDSVIATQTNELTSMHFSEVWNAYNRVIDYIDTNNLSMDEKQFVDAIDHYRGVFNASQFLRRLYEVLQKTDNRHDSRLIQQDILDNLSAIDWHENGFYYACVYEHYRYWDATLALHDFQSFDNGHTHSYTVKWDVADLRINDVVGFTLRYAAQRLALPKADFEIFKSTLTRIEQHSTDNSVLFRIIAASISVGIDTIDSVNALEDGIWQKLQDEKYQPILHLISQHIFLDANERVGGSYHVRLCDLPILVDVLMETDAPTVHLDTINALGRALQCYSGDKKSQLITLIDYGLNNGFDQPLITAYPWLVNDPIQSLPNNNHLQVFYKQLSSIDFSRSTLPNKHTLTAMLNLIHTADDRHVAVRDLIAQKCYITDQDAAFRPLKSSEKRLIDELYLSKTFGEQNHSLLATLSEHLALKEEGDTRNSIKKLLECFSNLDRKNYYNELGQLLGLLVEKSRHNQYYSLEQLTVWINSVFDATVFNTHPYPVAFINTLISDALESKTSSLVNHDLHQLKTHEEDLEPLQAILGQVNVSNLPDLAKKTLVTCVVRFKDKDKRGLTDLFSRLHLVLQQLKDVRHVMIPFCTLIMVQIEHDPAKLLQNLVMLERLASPCPDHNHSLKQLWEKNQITLLKGIETATISEDNVILLVNTENSAVRMILIAALGSSDTTQLINTVKTQLLGVSPEDLLQLAIYYQTDPKPTLQQLNTLLASQPSVIALIDYFERVVQAENKRTYSLDEKDAEDIQRVIQKFKLKRKTVSQDEKSEILHSFYYINTYSQVQRLEDKNNQELLDLIQTNKDSHTDEADARVVACMREMVLRKTGKWVNHTQMLDVIYAVMHNKDNMLHQVYMGEGKSILTIMRVAYRAFNGQMIDVFSSKDSLPSRDHQEFSCVLDAFGIRHSYITAKSDPTEYYHTVDEQGVGAVHYATIGNWSLFFCGLRWENKAFSIDIHADNRVAYLDEGDHIMRCENTLFNFSDQAEAASVYNFDAWVYQVVFDFYLENQEVLKCQEFNVKEQPDLQALYQKLQVSALTIAPDKSTYFQKYLASGDVTLRNQTLLTLLSAAHLAKHLEKDVDFCVMADQKKISDSITLDTRFAKVMINNQVYHGSTYSDLVQQFLHVRLNRDAINASETPNFFIDPESEIALSLNTRYVLKNYYKQIEACTGTPGNEEALDFYASEFDIDRVIKLPTHQDTKTLFLPPIYAQDEAAQVAQIVLSIQDNPTQPILITCEDDKAVLRLGELIQQALGKKRVIVIDTNAKGFGEAEISKEAGKEGAITISSRMGRGTDIRPYDRELGLKVIRTYPATPEIVKQEQGRQGRNGAGGVCQDILNYDAIERELKIYQEDARFVPILENERTHLEEKLAKHTNQDKEIWRAIKQNDLLKNKYLYTRSLQRLKHIIQEISMRRTHEKNALISEGSGEVMEHLRGLSFRAERRVKAAWKSCKKAIEAGWADDLDGRAMLNDFYLKNRIQPRQPAQHSRPIAERHQREQYVGVPLKEQISFHQQWLKGIHDYWEHSDHSQDHTLFTALCGESGAHFDAAYGAFQHLNAEQLATFSELAAKYPSCHGISCAAWVTAIDWVMSDQDISETYAERLNIFFTRSNGFIPKTAQEVAEISKSFLSAIAGAPDIQFLKDIIHDNYPEARHHKLLEIVAQLPRQVVDLCKNGMAQEDVVFFLNALSMPKANTTRCIDYLVSHHKQLKEATYMIRSLSMLLLQHTDNIFFDGLSYNTKTASLLDFLSQRPGFTLKDYHVIQAKIDRITVDYQARFLTMLASIPPYITLRTVLLDLNDLPGKHSFSDGIDVVQNRIYLIQSAAKIFNEFLFSHDLIVSKHCFGEPKNADDYGAWNTIFSKMPLDNREYFFKMVSKLTHLKIEQLKSLAQDYSDKLSNVTLETEVNKLLQGEPTKLSDAGVSASAPTFFGRR